MKQLGTTYETGLGVDKDMAQARQWYTQAAKAGDTQAKAWLIAHRFN